MHKHTRADTLSHTICPEPGPEGLLFPFLGNLYSSSHCTHSPAGSLSHIKTLDPAFPETDLLSRELWEK